MLILTPFHMWYSQVHINGTNTHPTTAGDPMWAPDPSQCGEHDPRIDEFGYFKGRVHHTLAHSPGNSTIARHKHAITTQPIEFEKLRPYFGWVNKYTI